MSALTAVKFVPIFLYQETKDPTSSNCFFFVINVILGYV